MVIVPVTYRGDTPPDGERVIPSDTEPIPPGLAQPRRIAPHPTGGGTEAGPPPELVAFFRQAREMAETSRRRKNEILGDAAEARTGQAEPENPPCFGESLKLETEARL